MKIGLVVPQFVDDPAITLRFALAAEEAGVDGVFVFDHLWPFGKTSGPAVSAMPMLSAICAQTTSVRVGTLVARVGIVDNQHLLGQFQTAQSIAGDRLIAGLGIGDSASKPENDAYGVEFLPRPQRLELLESAGKAISTAGIEVWLGGRSKPVTDLAAKHGWGRNLWDCPVEQLAEVKPSSGVLTWGGRVEPSAEAMELKLSEVSAVGADWAIFLVSGSGADPESAIDAVKSLKTDTAKGHPAHKH